MAEKAHRFDQHPEIQAALEEAGVPDLGKPSVGPCSSAEAHELLASNSTSTGAGEPSLRAWVPRPARCRVPAGNAMRDPSRISSPAYAVRAIGRPMDNSAQITGW